MKKFLASIVIIVMAIALLAACTPESQGGEVLDSDFKIIKEQEAPTTGTPDDYSPLENMAFASYKFNRLTSWEGHYTGEVTAIGTRQHVENVRKYDGTVLFAQALSVSTVKTVAEQKYFKGNTILYRPYVKIDKNTLKTTWSNSIVQLSREDYFRDYGIIPTEIFRFVIDENTVTHSEDISDGENYIYRFVLIPDSAKYFKNEVRTMAGSKSDPEYLSIECTIEIDKEWNILKTTSKENYKVAILGGITCESNATELFTLGGEVDIADRAIFEAYAPSDDEETIGGGNVIEQPKQPIDYLTLAFANLAGDGVIKLAADVNGANILINFDANTGLAAFKFGDTIVKSTGDYVYLLGNTKVKFDTLSLYDALFMIVNNLPKTDNLLKNAPETQALIGEVIGMISGSENTSGTGGESIINRIVDSMDMDVDDNEVATVTMNFTLDGIAFDVKITVADEKLSSIVGKITLGEFALDITVSPTDKEIVADISGASDISDLVEALSDTIETGYISLENDDFLLTANLDGSVYFNSEVLDAFYKDKSIKVDFFGKKLSFDLDALELPAFETDIFSLIKAASSITALPFDAVISASDNKLDIALTIDQTDVNITLSAVDGKLDARINAMDMTLTTSANIASIDEKANYVDGNNLLKYAMTLLDNGRIDLLLKPTIGGFNPDINISLDFSDMILVAQMDGTTVQVALTELDAIYLFNNNLKGKVTLDCLTSLLPQFDPKSIDVKAIINSILANCEFGNIGDNLVIDYKGEIAGIPLTIKMSISESLIVNGKITIDGKEYKFDLSEHATKVAPKSTDGAVVLDSLVKYAKATFENGRIDLNLKSAIGSFEPDVNLSLSFEDMVLAAQMEDTTLQVALKETNDAIYIFNNNLKGKVTFECLTSILPEFDAESIDIKAIINNILTTATFSNKGNDLVINYNGEIAGIPLTVNVTISESLSVNGKITIDEKEYKFDLNEHATQVAPKSTDGAVVLDSLVKYAKATYENGRIDLKLKPSIGDFEPDINISLSFEDMILAAQMDDTTVQVALKELDDAIYILNNNLKGKITFDCLTSLLPDFDPNNIDVKAIINNILANCEFGNIGNNLVIDYKGEIGGIPLTVKMSISESLSVNGKITIDGKEYKFDLSEHAKQVDLFSTDGAVVLDSLVKYAKATFENGRIDLNLKSAIGSFEPDINISLSFEDMVLAAQMEDTTLQVALKETNDAIYIFNNNLKGKVTFECLTSLLPEFDTESIDIKAIITNILSTATFSNIGNNLVISYNGTVAGISLAIKLTVSDKLNVNGSVTINEKAYTFDLSQHAEQIAPLSTDGAVVLDSLVKYAKATFDSGRIDLKLKPSIGDFEPDINISLDFEDMILVAQIDDTTVQAALKELDAIYLLNNNLKGKVTLDCLTSLLPDFDPNNIDFKAIINNILMGCEFGNIGNNLVIDYKGEIAGIPLTVKMSISESLSVNGKITIDGKEYKFDLNENATQVDSFLTDGAVVLDSLVKYAKATFENGRIDLNLKSAIGSFEPDINLSLDFSDMILVAQMEDTTVQVALKELDDAIYIFNNNLKGKITFECLTSLLPDFDPESIDVKAIINNILSTATFSNIGNNLVVNYSGEIAGIPLTVNVTISESLSVNGKITIDGKEYKFDLNENATQVDSFLTDGAVVLDSLVKYAKATFDNGRIDMLLKPTIGDFNPDINISLDLEDMILAAQMEDTTVQVALKELDDAIYILNNNLKGKVTFDCLTSLLPEFDPKSIDFKAIITNILSTATFGNENSDLVINYNGTVAGIPLTVNVTISESLSVNGKITIDGKEYKFDLNENATQVDSFLTDGAVILDSLVKYAKATYDNGRIDLNLKSAIGSFEPDINISLRFEDMILVAQMDDTTLQVALKELDDAIYLFNSNLKGKVTFDCLTSILPDFDTESIDVKAIINNILTTATFSNEGKNLVINYNGEIAGIPLTVNVTISESLSVNGKITIDEEKEYTFDLNEHATQVAPLSTDGTVVLDSLVKYAKSAIDNGRIDMQLTTTVDKYAPVIDASLILESKTIVAKMGDTVLQVPLQDLSNSAVYIFNNNVKGKLSLSCLTSLIPDFDPNIDPMELISDILSKATFENDEGLIINFSGEFAGIDIKLTATVTESLVISGSLTINGEAYSFSISDKTNELKVLDTKECVLLDPIVYTAVDMMNELPAFEATISSGNISLGALLKVDEYKNIIIKLGQNNLYAMESKLYFENTKGKYSFLYKNLNQLLHNMGIAIEVDYEELLAYFDVEGTIGTIISGDSAEIMSNVSLTSQDNWLNLSVKLGGITVALTFDYTQNYIDHADIAFGPCNVRITCSDEELTVPDSFDDYDSIDYPVELIDPIKNIIDEKQFTFTFTDLLISGDSPIKINGSLALDSVDGLKIYIDAAITVIDQVEGAEPTETTHKIKVSLTGDDAIIIYNDSLKASLNKDNLLRIAFNIMDIMGVHSTALERFRPEMTVLSSEIIYNALNDMGTGVLDTIVNFMESWGPDEGGMTLIEMLEVLEISGDENNIIVTLNTESPSQFTIYHDDEDMYVNIESAAVSGKINVAFTASPVDLSKFKYNYDFNSLTQLVEYAMNTVNLGEYSVSGTINLNLIGFINIDIPATLTAKIVDNRYPVVYLMLDVPYSALGLTKSKSYLFFCDGYIYLKRELYKAGFLGLTQSYNKTEYMPKMTTEEFADDILNNLLFLVPLSDTMKNIIFDNIAPSESSNIDFTNALTNYAYNGSKFDVTIDLGALIGDKNLGDLALTLTTATGNDGNKMINKFNIKMKMVTVISLTVTADLITYNGKVTLGTNSEKATCDLTDMSNQIAELAKNISAWQ